MKKAGIIVYMMITVLLLSLAGCGGGGGGSDHGDGFSGEVSAPISDGIGDQTNGAGGVNTPGAAPEAGAPSGSAGEGGSISAPPAPDLSTGGGAVVGAGAAVGAASWDGQKPARSKTVMVSAPGTLSQADTEYVLTQDVAAAGTVFTIAASNVTLNLNGKTVTYANGSASGARYGVTVQKYGLKDIAIVNGTIRQGSAASATNDAQAGWHAICFTPDVPGFKLAGLKIEYRTPETSAVYATWGKSAEIAYNDFNDLGSRVINRHQLVSVIKTNRGGQMKIHHNHIVRARQGGMDIGPGAVVYENLIHVDSVTTNSYGISVFEVDGFTLYNNTIIGKGIHPIGIGMVAKTKNGKVYSNRIETQNTKSGAEYGSTGSAGMRMTWGTDNVELWGNHITVHAQANLLGPGQDSWGRGLWLGLPDAAAKVTFRDNTIIARNNDGKGKAAGIAIVCLNKSPGLVFRNNLVISNWGNVVLADDYGHADGNARFVGNTFRREDSHSTYRTIRSDYKTYVSTGVFIANAYENGAAATSIDGQFSSTLLKEMAFGWLCTLTVTNGGASVPGATVQIVDNSGAQVFSGTTDAGGKIVAQLTEYLATNKTSYSVAGKFQKDAFGAYGNKIVKNPYTVKVQGAGKSASKTFEITSSQQMTIGL